MYASGNPLRYADPTGHYVCEKEPVDPYIWRWDKLSTTLVRMKVPVIFWEETQQLHLFLPLKAIYGGALVMPVGVIVLEDAVGLAAGEAIATFIPSATQAWRRVSSQVEQRIFEMPG